MQDPVFVHHAFEKIAPRYVLTNHVLSMGTDILWRKTVARLVRDFHPERVLDLATGSGDLAVEILKKSPGAKVIGADFCEPMLNEARKRKTPGLEWLVADAMHLPFADGEFDVVTVGFGLRNMSSWPDAVREMCRVIRPGGHLVILDFSLPPWPVVRGAYRFYLHKVMPAVAGAITRQRQAYEYLGGSIEKFPSGPAMCGLLQENGFATAAAKPLNFGIASIYLAEKPPGTKISG